MHTVIVDECDLIVAHEPGLDQCLVVDVVGQDDEGEHTSYELHQSSAWSTRVDRTYFMT
jgi:hypothetical protein